MRNYEDNMIEGIPKSFGNYRNGSERYRNGSERDRNGSGGSEMVSRSIGMCSDDLGNVPGGI